MARRLRRHEVCGRTITLKVKYHDFKQITRSVTLPSATCDEGEIYAAIKTLLVKTEAGRVPVRLLGVSVSGLTAGEAGQQLSLFAAPARKAPDARVCTRPWTASPTNTAIRPSNRPLYWRKRGQSEAIAAKKLVTMKIQVHR